MTRGLVKKDLAEVASGRRFESDLSNQSRKHQFQFVDPPFQRFILSGSQKLKIPAQQQEVIQFTRRSKRQVQKLPQLHSSSPAAAFGNVRRNGVSSASHLACKPVALLLGKVVGRAVDAQDHGMTFLPDRQLPKVLHLCTPLTGLVFTYYLILITYNSARGTLQCF